MPENCEEMGDLARKLADAVTLKGGEGYKDRCQPDPMALEPYGTPKPLAENAAWLKAWLLADTGRRDELVLVIREQFATDWEYPPDASEEAVLFMLYMTPSEFAECLLAAKGRVPK